MKGLLASIETVLAEKSVRNVMCKLVWPAKEQVFGGHG
jgi:hypothetical protein